MEKIITITGSLVLLLASLGSAFGQGTIHVTFDGPPTMPPGSSSSGWYIYSESGVGFSSLGSGDGFTRRWSGDPFFPDNGTAYVQAGRSGVSFFDYWGSSKRFDAVSVDLALRGGSSLEPVTVQFAAWGYAFGELIAATEFTVTGAVDGQGRPLFQTFNFPPEFRGMYYLSVTNIPSWSLDNLVITAIPEPSVYALLGAGVFFLWAWRRRG